MAPADRVATTPPDEDGPEVPRPRLHRILTIAVPALVVGGLLLFGIIRPAQQGTGTERAPSFELPLVGAPGTLSSDDLSGDPVVLNFWASWCVPCREEMPAFERLWRKYRGEGIQIVGVNIQDSTEGAEEFVDELGITYPIVYDGDQELAGRLGVYGLPETYFITDDYELTGETETGPTVGTTPGVAGPGDGVVFGAISEEVLEERIRALIAERD